MCSESKAHCDWKQWRSFSYIHIEESGNSRPYFGKRLSRRSFRSRVDRSTYWIPILGSHAYANMLSFQTGNSIGALGYVRMLVLTPVIPTSTHQSVVIPSLRGDIG